jgi:hypothetical protein
VLRPFAVDLISQLAPRLADWRVLVNCASVFQLDQVDALDPQVFEHAMQVNAATPAVLAQAFLAQARSPQGRRVINVTDQKIANPNPDFFGGINTKLTYGNWALDALATFSVGGDAYNYARRQLESQVGYANQTEAVMRRWRTDGQQTDIPKATWGDPMGNSRFSDRWIEDASYLRLKTVSLSYKVPVKPTALKYIHIYATANNLVTFSKYLGYDPEFSATAGIYGQGVDTFLEPQYKYVQLGVRFGL